jgi:hypothetical protein
MKTEMRLLFLRIIIRERGHLLANVKEKKKTTIKLKEKRKKEK